MPDSVAVIADSHLGGPGGEAGPFIEQLRSLSARGCERLILLGDIFHVWVGSRSFETPEVRAVIDVLRELRRDGLVIEYVEGNRDFFIQNSIYADAFDRIALEVHFEVGGVRYLAVHGDGLNDNDKQYLFWRSLSKSKPVRFLVFHLPGFIARRAMHSTEQQLGRTNWKHKSRVPEEAIRSYGGRRLGKDYDVLLLGHFHEPHTWTIEGGEIRLLDAWFNSRQIEWFTAKNKESKSDTMRSEI